MGPSLLDVKINLPELVEVRVNWLKHLIYQKKITGRIFIHMVNYILHAIHRHFLFLFRNFDVSYECKAILSIIPAKTRLAPVLFINFSGNVWVRILDWKIYIFWKFCRDSLFYVYHVYLLKNFCQIIKFIKIENRYWFFLHQYMKNIWI